MKNYWLTKRREKEVPKWDFLSALRDTIGEKYESLYIRVVEIKSISCRNTVGETLWLDPEFRKD